jgi:SepF-like predicted cell division protein (DUF552 family)
MPFNLFHKKKHPEQETPAVPPQEETKQEAATPIPEEMSQESVAPAEKVVEEPTPVQEMLKETVPAPEPIQVMAPPPIEEPAAPEPPSKTYLKAMPLKELSDLENIKTEVKNGNIIILRVTPLAGKSIEDVKTAVNELFQFAESIGGDIARLGEERVFYFGKKIKIF